MSNSSLSTNPEWHTEFLEKNGQMLLYDALFEKATPSWLGCTSLHTKV
jgi:hypothetical protein